MALIRYLWNIPHNVAKDAKYVVRHHHGRLEVALLYRTSHGEEWTVSTADHPDLVRMVNEIKLETTGKPGGTFYINEYRQVIVPAADRSDSYYYAGEYLQDLAFGFEGKVVSSRAADLDGRPLKPGDEWLGAHPGIPYVLKAGGNDIAFKRPLRPNVTREELLSRHTSPKEASELARRIQAVKGFQGGRFYINERRHLFCPLYAGGEVSYLYIGDLEPWDPWFPKWEPSKEQPELD